MHALSGLLGEEETALSAEQAAVDQSRKALEMQNRALRTVLQNVKPFAKAPRCASASRLCARSCARRTRRASQATAAV